MSRNCVLWTNVRDAPLLDSLSVRNRTQAYKVIHMLPIHVTLFLSSFPAGMLRTKHPILAIELVQ